MIYGNEEGVTEFTTNQNGDIIHKLKLQKNELHKFSPKPQNDQTKQLHKIDNNTNKELVEHNVDVEMLKNLLSKKCDEGLNEESLIMHDMFLEILDEEYAEEKRKKINEVKIEKSTHHPQFKFNENLLSERLSEIKIDQQIKNTINEIPLNQNEIEKLENLSNLLVINDAEVVYDQTHPAVKQEKKDRHLFEKYDKPQVYLTEEQIINHEFNIIQRNVNKITEFEIPDENISAKFWKIMSSKKLLKNYDFLNVLEKFQCKEITSIQYTNETKLINAPKIAINMAQQFSKQLDLIYNLEKTSLATLLFYMLGKVTFNKLINGCVSYIRNTINSVSF